MKRVIVGLSGGVDSSVSAYLLQQQGYEVIGLFMKNWHDESVIIDNECPWIEDSNDALIVAQQLGIPFQTIDLSAAYKERIVNYMFAEYESGRTPNPDVLCNREIKFDVFLHAALELGADYVATGHYCRKVTEQTGDTKQYRLLAGLDKNKDQSYFLCQLTQEQLRYALFPIGHLQKAEVRAIAHDIGLNNAEKKDSQGLCFVGKIKLPDFLQQQLHAKRGTVIEIPASNQKYHIYNELITQNNTDSKNETNLKACCESFHYDQNMGTHVGDHNGAHFFTIGQRKGLGIGGKKEPLFVIETDVNENIVYVGQGEHPGLYRKGLMILHNDIHWVRPDLKILHGESMKYQARIRYRQPLQSATLHHGSEGFYLLFDELQRGISPGQFAAWYLNDELIGSGVINK